MTQLIYQFSEQNILIKSTGRHQYTFEFNGTEEQFVVALQQVMSNYGYIKQHDDWFPGKPGGDNENEMYYIELADDEMYMAFDWHNKEFYLG